MDGSRVRCARVLDDKKLVEQFEKRIQTAHQAESFAFTLLRARYLFDRFVIKTDLTRAGDDDSNWVLNRVRELDSKLSPKSTFESSGGTERAPRSESDHWHVVMLQSMFQVMDSRRRYKTSCTQRSTTSTARTMSSRATSSLTCSALRAIGTPRRLTPIDSTRVHPCPTSR